MSLRSFARALRPTAALALVFWLAVPLAGCTGADSTSASAPETSILALGDSVFDFYADTGASIPDVVGQTLGRGVLNAAESGARISHPDPSAVREGLDIRAQYREGDWAWVVFDGGGNDVGDECSCGACDAVVDGLIGEDGRTGEIPDLAQGLAATGAQVVYVGYYDIPDDADAFGTCDVELNALNRRAGRMASALEGVWYVWSGEVVTPADRSAYAADGFHPSERGARLIGEQVAAAIRAVEAGETP